MPLGQRKYRAYLSTNPSLVVTCQKRRPRKQLRGRRRLLKLERLNTRLVRVPQAPERHITHHIAAIKNRVALTPLTPRFRVLGLVNVCYAILCAFIVLEPKPEHKPNEDPRLDDIQAENEALGACFLVGAGCINLAVACVRFYQIGSSSSLAECATTMSFVLAGGLNHATAYLFLRARLRAVGRPPPPPPPESAGGLQFWMDAKRKGSLERC